MMTVKKQQGMTLIGMLMAAVVVGLVAVALMRIVPMYLNDQKIASIFEQISKETQGSKAAVMASIERRLDVNMVEHVKKTDFKIEPGPANTLKVTLDYESRANLAANLYVVAVFKHSVNVK